MTETGSYEPAPVQFHSPLNPIAHNIAMGTVLIVTCTPSRSDDRKML